MGRDLVLVVLVIVVSLAGCVGDPPPPPIFVDTRMPVIVDTNPHRVLHPPVKRANGRLDSDDPRPARERNFEPQSLLEAPQTEPKAHAGSLFAALDAFRLSEPVGGDRFLGLATKHKPKIRTANHEPVLAGQGDPEAPQAANPPTSSDPNGPDGGYRLSFEDAEIKDVLQAVLGKVLGLSYAIAPNVSGRITISSSAPQSRTELLSTLETVLSLQGLSLTKVGSTYRVAPVALGGGIVDVTGKEPGFGITVVPLEFSSVGSINKLLSGFVTDADGIRIDASRNAVIVRGPGPRREEIVRAIKAFDSDWMRQQAVSVFELRRSRPDEIIQELSRIFNADATGDGVIQFKAMKRLRSIMVISRNPRLIRRAAEWIRRLDHQDTSATDSVFVYRPRYRDAKEMVKLVNGLFNADSGGGSVAFQTQGGQPGQTGAFGQTGQQNTQPTQGPIGSSSSSFAGGLSSNGLGSPGNSQSQNGGNGGGAFGSGFGATQQTLGSGLTGALADPIEAGQTPTGSGSKLKLTADVSNNTIVAYTDGETYAKVQSILRQIDIPPLQVAVNVIVAEVQLNDELKYGIQFYLNNNRGSIGLGQVLSTAGTTAISPQAAGFNFLFGGASSPNVIINALDTISKVHILSTPSIVVQENKPAIFEVGNQVPIITQSATSSFTAGAPTLNQVTYLDTGIILKIIPRVGTNGDVAMDLDQVISSVVPNATGGTDTSLTPTISKRRINSAISVRSGQTVLLAGLINDTRQQQKGQIPFLGNAIGDVLGNRDNVLSRNELVIFIRPVIIRNGQDASDVASEFKTHLKAMNVHGAPVYKP